MQRLALLAARRRGGQTLLSKAKSCEAQQDRRVLYRTAELASECSSSAAAAAAGSVASEARSESGQASAGLFTHSDFLRVVLFVSCRASWGSGLSELISSPAVACLAG